MEIFSVSFLRSCFSRLCWRQVDFRCLSWTGVQKTNRCIPISKTTVRPRLLAQWVGLDLDDASLACTWDTGHDIFLGGGPEAFQGLRTSSLDSSESKLLKIPLEGGNNIYVQVGKGWLGKWALLWSGSSGVKVQGCVNIGSCHLACCH